MRLTLGRINAFLFNTEMESLALTLGVEFTEDSLDSPLNNDATNNGAIGSAVCNEAGIIYAFGLLAIERSRCSQRSLCQCYENLPRISILLTAKTPYIGVSD